MIRIASIILITVGLPIAIIPKVTVVETLLVMELSFVGLAGGAVSYTGGLSLSMATLLIAAIETAISLSVMLKYFEMANTIRVDFIDQLKA